MEIKEAIEKANEFFGLQVCARTRKREYVDARAMTSAWLRYEKKLSLPQVGRYLGHRHHTSIMNALDLDDAMQGQCRNYRKKRAELFNLLNGTKYHTIKIDDEVMIELMRYNANPAEALRQVLGLNNVVVEDSQITFEQRVKASFMKHEGRDEAEIAYRLSIPLRQARELIQA